MRANNPAAPTVTPVSRPRQTRMRRHHDALDAVRPEPEYSWRA